MKNKGILVCTVCMSRNYVYKFSPNRKNSISLNKYCSKCRKNLPHSENR